MLEQTIYSIHDKLENLSTKLNLILFFIDKRIKKAIVISSITTVVFFFVLLFGISFSNIYALSFGLLFFVIFLCITVFLVKRSYADMITFKKRKSRPLSPQEKELVEDAVELIKKVDNKITIAKFNVFSLNFGHSFFCNRSSNLDIYITFSKILLFSKDVCFKTVLHEIMHSQNLRSNICIFTNEFLEGLNEYLTIWLISNYSKKYKIVCYPNKKLNLPFKELTFYTNGLSYTKEVILVHELLKNANVDMKELFINYVEFNPDYFKKFVPKKYIKQ